ncbi:MAG: hypothetical protein MZW92_01395 [Comamonadaceae bacterium]|nr:hypothetical protein [Comamonadaceae bacterium]
MKHRVFYGLVLGAVSGLLLGSWMVLSPPTGIRLELVTLLATCLGGALPGRQGGEPGGGVGPQCSSAAFRGGGGPRQGVADGRCAARAR